MDRFQIDLKDRPLAPLRVDKKIIERPSWLMQGEAMISPAQIRAARGLLDLSQAELATISGVGLTTVRRIENSNAELSGSATTLLKLHAALVERGVVFIPESDSSGPGVKLREPRRRD